MKSLMISSFQKIEHMPWIALVRLFLMVFCIAPSASRATVHTGVDTLTIYKYEGLDFSEVAHVFEADADLSFNQIQDLNTVTADPAVLIAPGGLRDLGAVPFDSLTSVLETLGPDPEGAVRDSQTGEILRWFSLLIEGHIYLVWTQEGHLAKIFIEEIISFSDLREELSSSLWDQFIISVVLRWAYQDDGSRSFEIGTAVPETSWGCLKFLSKEGTQ